MTALRLVTERNHQLADDFIGPVDVRTLTSDEYSEFTVLRDVTLYGSNEYIRNALVRAAAAADAKAASTPAGYHRHWNMVDAQIFRNLARDFA